MALRLSTSSRSRVQALALYATRARPGRRVALATATRRRSSPDRGRTRHAVASHHVGSRLRQEEWSEPFEPHRLLDERQRRTRSREPELFVPASRKEAQSALAVGRSWSRARFPILRCWRSAAL